MYTREKEKRIQEDIFFYLSTLDQIFQQFHLNSSVAQLPTCVRQKIHLILSVSEAVISLEMREESKSNVTNVSI